MLIYTYDDGNRSHCSRTMGSEITQEVFAICQTKKVLILSGRCLVPQLYDVLKKYPHEEHKNQGNQAVA